jgi:hypothetical protein
MVDRLPTILRTQGHSASKYILLGCIHLSLPSPGSGSDSSRVSGDNPLLKMITNKSVLLDEFLNPPEIHSAYFIRFSSHHFRILLLIISLSDDQFDAQFIILTVFMNLRGSQFMRTTFYSRTVL